MTETNGTVVNISTVMTREALIAQASAKFAAEVFTPPGWDGAVRLRNLKGSEEDALFVWIRDNGDGSIFRYNAMVCSLGVMEPKLTFEEWLEMPADVLKANAERILEKTRAGREAERAKAADGPRPFLDLSSRSTASPSPSDEPRPKSAAR